MQKIIDTTTLRLAWDEDTNDWKRNTTGKLEATYMDRGVPGGRKRYMSTGHTDLASAQAYVRSLKGDLQDAQFDRLVEPTFRETLDLYVGSPTFDSDRKLYRIKAARILEAFGDRRLSTLTYVDIDQYSRARLATCSGGTLRNDLGVLKTCRTFAVKRKYIPKEKIGDLIDIDRPAEQRWSNRTALTEAQVDDLWNIFLAYRPHNVRRDRMTRVARFGCIAIDTGARRGAIEGLKWGQVDFVRRQIDFRTANDPANKRKAVCPMSPRLFELLMQARAEAIGDHVCDRPTRLKGAFDNALDGTGYEFVHPHLFRHSFITHQVMRGAPLSAVAEMVNDNEETLRERYLHLTPDYAHRNVKWSDAQKRAVVTPLKAAE